jgi:flagellar biosynthesis protein FlhF
MKIKTYIARDMRKALRLVREDQGPDAVIISTRQIPEGVEVTAAMEPEEALSIAATHPDLSTPAQPQPSHFAELLAHSTAAPAIQALDSRDADQPAGLGAELRTMRHLLETQLAQLAWNDLTRRAPAIAELLKLLTELGLATSLTTELLRELPAGIGMEDAQRHVLAQLSRRIAVTGDAVLDRGGRIAFVGPTGVGKTTGIAKLAARWVMRHGTRDIALISIDNQRFGAHEQLRVLGRLLGVECFSLESASELPTLISRLPGHQLILIDTAGASPRDADLQDRAAAMSKVAQKADIEVWLTLSAGAQAGVLEEAAQRFSVFKPVNIMMTKMDEASSLGGVLSTLVRCGLPLTFVSEGPRIPEDLAPARAHQIVSRAVTLARENGAAAGEDLLSRRYGGDAHGIA